MAMGITIYDDLVESVTCGTLARQKERITKPQTDRSELTTKRRKSKIIHNFCILLLIFVLASTKPCISNETSVY